MKFSLH